MGEQTKKPNISAGLLAHVDAGKTTLSEALLYCSGARRSLGRVDHGDTLLDTEPLERERGITIFSKQARLETASRQVVLLDTPGHADFTAEAERVLPVLDCAILVISGTDSIQAHTGTLWQLLERYQVPTFLFVNKMDLPGTDRKTLLAQLREHLSPWCTDMGEPWEEIREAAALCDEALLESYLSGGEITEGNIRELTAQRRFFPCCFGSALRVEGVRELLEALDRYAPMPEYPADFAARVYKISRDRQGTRLTWLKVTGGTLRVRQPLSYVSLKGEALEEKPLQLRRYSGEKYTMAEAVAAGETVAVTGLSASWAGMSLGAEPPGLPPAMEPVMTYRLCLPGGVDPALALPKLRLLEEEEPQLHLLWQNGQIHVQVMGKIQQEILRGLCKERLGLDVTLEDRRVCYKETIRSRVEGVGHFEPLRHYAEVHLLLEPLPQGSGLQFATTCPLDLLEAGYQNLILTHLGEKSHRGVLTGAPITDMKITLLAGRAHLKHTEGGDFRQATYRAVRQGLMQAESVLLEPWYDFSVTAPAEQIGRTISDIREMGGSFDPPETRGELSEVRGKVPASEIRDYGDRVAAYTQGRGRFSLSLRGYEPCHNQEAVLAATDYDPEADTENTPDSVFCAHGAGFVVKWDKVKDYMHLDSGLPENRPLMPVYRAPIDDRELEAIMEREFGPIRRRQYSSPAPRSEAATEIRPLRKKCILVDGYNIIFAWEQLSAQAKTDLDAARRQLCDILSNYASFTGCRVVVVFDGYQRPGNLGEKQEIQNIQVVFTKEGETADRYLESLAAQIGKNESVWVASSDALVQLSSFRSGTLRMSARELEAETERVYRQMGKFFHA